MKILVINDDGISSPGLAKLAELAKRYGDVTVVAPASQCSGMSQKITIAVDLELKREPSFPVDGVDAWSITGTPVDCAKSAIMFAMGQKPDLVFSGINLGFNTGFDIAYSGTVGGAMEALMQGVRTIAFSTDEYPVYGAFDTYAPLLVDEILSLPPLEGALWNLNFPSIPAEEVKGVLHTGIAPMPIYSDHYDVKLRSADRYILCGRGRRANPDDLPEGTDGWAVLNGYISVGKIPCSVL